MAVLAIDSGGSKTHIRISDDTGNMLYESYCAGIGKAVDNECEELSEFQNDVSDSVGKAGLNYEDIKAVVVNLGGKNTVQTKNNLRSIFQSCQIRVYRESSSEVSIQFAKESGAGAVLLAGTGSICTAFNEQMVYTAGGWGQDIGDDGSGYWIGLEAVRCSLMELDGEKPLSMLAQKITGQQIPLSAEKEPEVLMKKRDNVRTMINPRTRSHIASYAKVVCECAEHGDVVAIEILKEAGVLLAELAVKTIKKVFSDQPGHLIISGGLIHCISFWEDTFKNHFNANLENWEFSCKKNGLIEGTTQLALNLLKEN